MADEPVRRRVMDFLRHHDGFAYVGGIAGAGLAGLALARTHMD